MCGRFSRASEKAAIVESLAVDSVGEGVDFRPRWNVAPSHDVLAVVAAPDGERRLGELLWGLIPGFTQDIQKARRPINARSETAAIKPTFRAAYARRRCAIVADGFYEWKRVGDGKVPHYVRLRSEAPFGFAGLWERWQGATGPAITTCAILTCPPSPSIQSIHDRMPVILTPENLHPWLDPTTPLGDLTPICTPYPDEALEAFPVSDRVSSIRNEGRELIRPLSEPPKNLTLSLFDR